MLQNDNTAAGSRTLEIKRYQPSFDLRKNIARIIGGHTMAALRKDITLDIFIAQETPNCFHGDVGRFSEMFSLLLEHSIESIDGGEICMRINHESLHQSNSCTTELSAVITTHSFTGNTSSGNTADRKISAICHKKAQRFKELSDYFDGSFRWFELDHHTIRYHVTFSLQQDLGAKILYLA